MFGLFRKDPTKTLQTQYERILSEAMTAQRNGDIRLYSELSEKAEKVRQELEAAKNGSQSSQ